MTVVAQFKTTDGSVWPTYTQAQVADAIEQTPSLYIESYKMKMIAEAVESLLKETSNETN